MSPLNPESRNRDGISLGLNFGISNLINQDQELTSIFFFWEIGDRDFAIRNVLKTYCSE
jgi:hypothetical protein